MADNYHQSFICLAAEFKLHIIYLMYTSIFSIHSKFVFFKKNKIKKEYNMLKLFFIILFISVLVVCYNMLSKTINKEMTALLMYMSTLIAIFIAVVICILLHTADILFIGLVLMASVMEIRRLLRKVL